jgi:hypothetical protein
MYALAAGAAGVSTLALASPAEAKIVYTPADVVIGQPFPLDFNHDGIVDFYILHQYKSHGPYFNGLAVCQVMSSYNNSRFCRDWGTNAVRAVVSKGKEFGAALRPGEKIQRGELFEYVTPLGGVVNFGKTSRYWYGPWVNGGKGVKNRYLGMKFKINGRFHFGWARITVKTTSNDFTATLTGYAYETVPGKAIVAGKTKGPDVVEHAALGILALGRK